MDDVIGKLGELLSDEESVRQLSELAQMLTSGDEGTEGEPENGNVKSTVDGPDISALMKLTGLMGAASQSDKNSELLLALKPHLKEDKQKRVDKAIKLLKLIAVWNMAKESGLLNELI